MPLPPKRIGVGQGPSLVSPRQWNAVADSATTRMTGAQGGSMLVNRANNQTVLRDTRRQILPLSGSTSGKFYATVSSVENDYLVCTDAESGATINVAKPYHLRKTPFDGLTFDLADGTTVKYVYDPTLPEYRRQAQDPSDSTIYVTQIITPLYTVDGGSNNACYIEVEPWGNTGVTDGSGNAITFQEVTGFRDWLAAVL